MRRESVILGAIIAVSLLILGGAAFLLSNPQQAPQEEKVTDTALLLGSKDHTIGTESAKVTIVEFADFQCPACGSAYPVVKQITEEYKDKIEFVYRHFPLPGHRNAIPAAQAAEAAGKQGKFFEMSELLFSNQAEWSEGNGAKEVFEGYAESLELDMEMFKADRDSSDTTAYIQNDQNDGLTLGVNSTPTFFIDGEKYSGVLGYDRLKEILDSKLQ